MLLVMRSASSIRRCQILLAIPATVVCICMFALLREADEPFVDASSPPSPELVLSGARDIDLPLSTLTDKVRPAGMVSVLVTRRHLWVGGDSKPIVTFLDGLAALSATGLPARFKRGGANDHYISDLGNGLGYFYQRSKVLHESAALAVIADAATPYSVLSDVLCTAERWDFERVYFAVRGRDAGVVWLATLPREIGPWTPSKGPMPDVFVSDDGFSIRWGCGRLAADCDPRAAGAVVAKADGKYDYRGLAECVRRARTAVADMQGETRFAIHAARTVDWQTLVSALDAVRGTDGGEALLPKFTCADHLYGEPGITSECEARGASGPPAVWRARGLNP